MTGAPRSAFSDGEFIAIRPEAVDLLGSWEAAGVWHRICWRSARNGGGWAASAELIAKECRLSLHKVRRALADLRAAGWIAGERAGSRDRTMRWVPVWQDEQQPSVENPHYVVGDSAAGNAENPHMVMRDSATTPISKTVKTVKTFTADAASEDGQLPILMAVPARTVAEQEPDQLGEEFAAFWSSWPDKRDRKAAEKAYRAARRRGVPAEVIAAGAAAHAPAFVRKIANGERGFVPHASTWLNKERWNDPPPPGPRVNPDAEAMRRIMAGQTATEAPASALESTARAMMGLPTRRQELA